jgi:hypothetical protein
VRIISGVTYFEESVREFWGTWRELKQPKTRPLKIELIRLSKADIKALEKKSKKSKGKNEEYTTSKK